MGTRGLRVYRYRKRYYALYNHWDSYPEGLGDKIVAEIPADKSEYQAWLSSQRAKVEGWETAYLRFITIMPGNKITEPAANDEDEDVEEGAKEEGSGDNDTTEDKDEEPSKQTPAWMDHHFPSFFTPVNDTYIEWVYTLVSIDGSTLS